jgi:hypothetical protein
MHNVANGKNFKTTALYWIVVLSKREDPDPDPNPKEIIMDPDHRGPKCYRSGRVVMTQQRQNKQINLNTTHSPH